MQENDLFFIRHAQSEINKATKDIVEQYKVENTYKALRHVPQWIHGVKYSMNFVDCPITQHGKLQCAKAKKKAQQINPDVILVSPLERTLQTCNLIFGDRNIPIFVEPILTEAIRSSCDLAAETQPKLLRYPQFNFDAVLKEGQYWNIQYDYQNYQKYLQKIQEVGAVTVQEKNKAVLQYMSEKLCYETPKNVRERTKKVKQLLAKYSERYNSVAVVAHFNTINFTVAKQFDEQNEPKNSIKIHNCQLYPTNLNEIMKVS